MLHLLIELRTLRFEEIKKLDIDKNIKDIFEVALEKRKDWKNIKVTTDEVGEWLNNFEDVVSHILKDNLYNVPEELINNK